MKKAIPFIVVVFLLIVNIILCFPKYHYFKQGDIVKNTIKSECMSTEGYDTYSFKYINSKGNTKTVEAEFPRKDRFNTIQFKKGYYYKTNAWFTTLQVLLWIAFIISFIALICDTNCYINKIEHGYSRCVEPGKHNCIFCIDHPLYEDKPCSFWG